MYLGIGGLDLVSNRYRTNFTRRIESDDGIGLKFLNLDSLDPAIMCERIRH